MLTSCRPLTDQPRVGIVSPGLCSLILPSGPSSGEPAGAGAVETLPRMWSHCSQDHLCRGDPGNHRICGQEASGPGVPDLPSLEARSTFYSSSQRPASRKVCSPETGVMKVPLPGAVPSVAEAWVSNSQRAFAPTRETNSSRDGLLYGFLTKSKEGRPKGPRSPPPRKGPLPGLGWVTPQSCVV